MTQTAAQLLQEAVALHQSGQLFEAGQLYQSILQIQPDHAEANHNLGVIAVQADQAAAGLPYLMAALDADPTRGPYWLTYIDALQQAGQGDDARAVLALARKQGLEGDDVEALAARLGEGPEKGTRAGTAPGKTERASARIAGKSPPRRDIDALVTQFQAGHYAEVAVLAQRMAERFHGFGPAWKILGIALQVLGREDEAIAPLQRAAALFPADVDVHCRLGLALFEAGRPDEAEASLRATLRIDPNYAEGHGHLATVLVAQGRLDEADAHFQIALSLDPEDADLWRRRGDLLAALARAKEAEACYRKALQIAPDVAESHVSLATLLRRLGRLEEAESCLRAALDDCPADINLRSNLGLTLMERGLPDEAEKCFRNVLEAKPDNAGALSNLGQVLLNLNRLDEADACFRQALQLRPDYAALYSNLLYYLTLNGSLDANAVFREHVGFGERFEGPLMRHVPKHTPAQEPERRLRVGFVSADFYNHAVASFIEPVLIHLAGDAQFSLHAYYNNFVDDRATQRLRGYFSSWRPVFGLSDAGLAERIRADGIDILIDLSGHTAGNRLLAFARKPAPLQVTWMGYPGTTGLASMDYYLADAVFLPPGRFDAQFTEKIVYLPANSPFLPVEDAPPVSGLPALRNGHLTFGSFSRPNKLSSTVVALWARLLRALPDSRMLLGGMPESGGCDDLIAWFEAEGVARERLSFHPRCATQPYLELHQQVDMCLDTFPYNGGTTTLHALWMGVPTLTLAGATAASRSGASILGHAGLEAFVADDPDAFVQKGLDWANRLGELAEIRAGLRERFMRSVRGQPALVAAGVAYGLRAMWRRWCAGHPATAFEVALADVERSARESHV